MQITQILTWIINLLHFTQKLSDVFFPDTGILKHRIQEKLRDDNSGGRELLHTRIWDDRVLRGFVLFKFGTLAIYAVLPGVHCIDS